MQSKFFKKQFIALVLTGLLVSGCDQSASPVADKAQGHVFKSQERALKKAKQVEQLMEKAEADRRKQLEKMIQ